MPGEVRTTGPRYFIINTEAGWKGTDLRNAEVTPEGISIMKDPVSTFVASQKMLQADGDDRFTDLALDECGNQYVTVVHRDAGGNALNGDVLFRPSDDMLADPAACRAGAVPIMTHLELLQPGCVVIGPDTIFIIDGGSLLSISRYLRQLRWRLDDDRFRQVRRMLLDGKGNVLLLIDRSEIVTVSPGGIVSDLAPPVEADPMDMALNEHGRLCILEKTADGPRVRRFSKSGDAVRSDVWVEGTAFKSVSPTSLPAQSCSMAVGSAGQLFLGESAGIGDGADRTLLRFVPGDGGFARVFIHRGAAARMVMDGCGDLYLLTEDGCSVHVLRHGQKNNLDGSLGYGSEATRQFDSGNPGTVWHRVKLDMEMPGPTVQVTCQYRASDDLWTPGGDDWTDLPHPNPRDALFLNAAGRFLWFRIRLLGTEFESPTVRSAQVYFPRDTYLRYLPAIYQEQAGPADLVARYLSLFESFFDDGGEAIGRIRSLYDPSAVPSEYLSWLGSWLGLAMSEGWSDGSKRALIAKAPELFKMRGTKEGLRQMLLIIIGSGSPQDQCWERAAAAEEDLIKRSILCGLLTEEGADEERKGYQDMVKGRLADTVGLPLILERFVYAAMEEGEEREQYLGLLDCPNCFVVLMGPSLGEDELATAQKLVDAERPAHTEGKVVGLRPWAYLGGHTYLGLNTVLTEPKFTLDKASLGTNSVLADREPMGQLDVRSGTGKDMTLS